MNKIRLIIILIWLLLHIIMLQAAALGGDKIVGIWQTDTKDARIQVYKVGNTYQAKILWLEHIGVPQNVPWLDNKNPNPALRKRTRENIVAMTGMEYTGNNKYKNGLVYYPTNGKTYDCCATLVNDNSLILRPYLGVRFLGYSIYFTKID